VLAAPVTGDSATVAAAVKGTNTSGLINAVAVQALVTGTNGAAVQATIGQATSPTNVGSYAVNAYHNGSGTAILAKSNTGPGLIGQGGDTAVAIRATSLGTGAALFAESSNNAGVYGRSTTNAGVFGDSPLVAVAGVSLNGLGVQGTSTTNAGVFGQSTYNAAVYGTSPYAGVYGTSSSVGVWGVSSGGTAVFGQSTGPGGFAGQF
jgi:hypothetical protein